MVVFSFYHNYSQLYKAVTNNRKGIVKEEVFIFITTKCRLWRNVGCLREFTMMFLFTYLRETITRNSFSLKSAASAEILQNFLVKNMLTSKIIM